MTIKTRNRINFVFFIITTLLLALNIFHLFYQLITKDFIFPEVYFTNEPSTSFVFGYNSIIVLISIFFESLLVSVVSFITYRVYSKTQSSIIVFFLLFLLGIFCDSSRFLLIFFHISGTYTKLVMIIGNIILFGRILCPLALMLAVLMIFDEQHQNINRNCLILLLSALFIAYMIPLNTGIIRPNFCISYAFEKVILMITIIIGIANTICLLIYSFNTKTSFNTTIGMALICIGYPIIFYCTTLFELIIGIAALVTGISFYLFQLHKDYLWK